MSDVNGADDFKYRKDVAVGDSLMSSSGGLSVVTSVTVRKLQGAHAPMTVDGTIIVDGHVASAYAQTPKVYAHGRTLVSAHTVAYLAVSPIRLAYKLGFEQGEYHDNSSGRHR